MANSAIISTASDFLTKVINLGHERTQGYDNREHGGVLNGRVADKVVALQEEGESVKNALDSFLVEYEKMEAQLNAALAALQHYGFEVDTPDCGKMAKTVISQALSGAKPD
jgi:hypothetical protein